MMDNLTIPQSFTTAAADTHYHKPITRRIYYNNYIVMVTNCVECNTELDRWLIDENAEKINISTSTCPIGVTDNIQVS